MALFALEGELFFGAAPELEGHLEEIQRRVDQGTKVVVLRMKRVRNPDMVCLEILERFLVNMHKQNVTVLLCGVRPDFAEVLKNVRFHHQLPPDCLFLEEATPGSSTLHAVRRAYEILGKQRCATCPRPPEPETPAQDLYYVI
jgi:SulP family sulfate permease